MARNCQHPPLPALTVRIQFATAGILIPVAVESEPEDGTLGQEKLRAE